MYKYVLFDLDGTLTDPGVGITSAVKYALEKWNIKVENLSDLNCFIGPPLIDSFMEYYGFSIEDAKKAIIYYREYYSVTGLFENEKYEGIENILRELKNSGKQLIVATSKPEKFSVQILEHFDLLKYFDFVAASTFDGTRDKKADVIRYAIDSVKIDNVNEAIMVGDRKHDIIGAKENNMKCISVLYGYGSRQEFEEYGADYIAEVPEDILDFVL